MRKHLFRRKNRLKASDWAKEKNKNNHRKNEYCQLLGGDKIKFKSRRKAFQFKLKLNEGNNLNIYQCTKCGNWHLTRLTKEKYHERKAYFESIRRAQ